MKYYSFVLQIHEKHYGGQIAADLKKRGACFAGHFYR